MDFGADELGWDTDSLGRAAVLPRRHVDGNLGPTIRRHWQATLLQLTSYPWNRTPCSLSCENPVEYCGHCSAPAAGWCQRSSRSRRSDLRMLIEQLRSLGVTIEHLLRNELHPAEEEPSWTEKPRVPHSLFYQHTCTCAATCSPKPSPPLLREPLCAHWTVVQVQETHRDRLGAVENKFAGGLKGAIARVPWRI